ncbi:MAG: phosphate ABC transporter ATP-binding protein [Planctomycetota bacterium]
MSGVPSAASAQAAAAAAAASGREHSAIQVRSMNLWYGDFQALHEVDLDIKPGIVTSMIGPSGCGKSTLLRSINRINERLGYVRTTGTIQVHGEDIYGPEASQIQVRRHVGMVFQRPNPLPLSVRDNVLFGHRLHRTERVSRSDEDAIVQQALEQVLLWDRIKDKLTTKATSLSLEEQQKLCIARLLPTKPKVLLMDEPCSALDPEATAAVEELIWELRGRYSILIVTHNMAQARRASDECVFMLLGRVVEHTATEDMFVSPQHKETADYIEGRFG